MDVRGFPRDVEQSAEQGNTLNTRFVDVPKGAKNKTALGFKKQEMHRVIYNPKYFNLLNTCFH